MPDFEFVHVNQPGDEKKNSTKVRRHVMKDIARDTQVDAAGPSTGAQAQDEQALVPSPLDESRLGDIAFPMEMDEERRNLMRFVFAGCRGSYRPFGLPWLNIGLADAGASYITLANAELFKQMKPGDSKPEFYANAKATKWYTLSLKSVSKRLADPNEANKQGLIAAITGFICHDARPLRSSLPKHPSSFRSAERLDDRYQHGERHSILQYALGFLGQELPLSRGHPERVKSNGSRRQLREPEWPGP
ncbi:hypothetical protein O1611_g10602 [Lasiodiplodia mahajangana]|uniref:Uncharacterized protein n=1 Tax=Lasiodiplodia mahajangana TaxID=1108764 RepID=A0ACC2IWB8_9PEZI|nr:hypothetical protein O1611_g10602 [Lasiodiplodia mahajangana]